MSPFFFKPRGVSNRLKGENRIAQAFRPGNHTHNEIALKGRPNPAGWQRRGMLSLVITPGSRPPFQGESPRYGLPCLKAWAILFSPFRRFDTHKKMAKLQAVFNPPGNDPPRQGAPKSKGPKISWVNPVRFLYVIFQPRSPRRPQPLVPLFRSYAE
jgi:hypothetical protein